MHDLSPGLYWPEWKARVWLLWETEKLRQCGRKDETVLRKVPLPSHENLVSEELKGTVTSALATPASLVSWEPLWRWQTMYSRYQFWKPHSQWGPFPAPAADATASLQANFVAITRVLVIYACILCSQRWRSSIQLANARPGADCGSDHELLIPKFRL